MGHSRHTPAETAVEEVEDEEEEEEGSQSITSKSSRRISPASGTPRRPVSDHGGNISTPEEPRNVQVLGRCRGRGEGD